MRHVHPSKITKASCSQADVVVVGKNVGKQYTAMSVCALLYHNMKGILNNLGDLKEVMLIGNPL